MRDSIRFRGNVYFSTRKASKEFGISRQAIARKLSEGTIGAIKLKRKWYVAESAYAAAFKISFNEPARIPIAEEESSSRFVARLPEIQGRRKAEPLQAMKAQKPQRVPTYRPIYAKTPLRAFSDRLAAIAVAFLAVAGVSSLFLGSTPPQAIQAAAASAAR